MAIQILREGNRKKGKIIGYKTRLPSNRGEGYKETTKNYLIKDYELSKEKAYEQASLDHAKAKDLRRRKKRGEWPTEKELEGWSVRDLIRNFMYSPLRASALALPAIDFDNRRILPAKRITPDDEEYHNYTALVNSCAREEDDLGLQENLGKMLIAFSKLKICDMSLAEFKSDQAVEYVEGMFRETFVSNGCTTPPKRYTLAYVKRRVVVLKYVWDWGIKYGRELKMLTNPWENIWKRVRIQRDVMLEHEKNWKRQRGLKWKKGELGRLLRACDNLLRGTNKSYVKLAICLAVDMGLRRATIVRLKWSNIDFNARTVFIEKDKTGPRLICLPPSTEAFLTDLAISLLETGCLRTGERIPGDFHPPHGLIFMGFERRPMTGGGFKQAFDDVRDEAGIIDVNPRKRLTPHSLRAAAQMAFRRALLDSDEIDYMKNGLKGRSPYDTEEFLDLIQPKLDRAYWGKTREEVEQDNHSLAYERLYLIARLQGLSPKDATEQAAAMMLEKYREYREYTGREIKEEVKSPTSRRSQLIEE